MSRYNEKYIVRRVSKKIRERTKENMDNFSMSLYDAFDEAVRFVSTKSVELRKAWYFSDYRKYIPSAYNCEYLDFDKYPLKYK